VRRKSDSWFSVGVAVVLSAALLTFLVVLLGGADDFCDIYRWSPAKEIPAYCFEQVTRG
jgi:hypothetical protein